MQSIAVKSFAKINLSLNITGVAQAMHTLDMIVTSVNLADVIVVKKQKHDSIGVRYSTPLIQVGKDSVSKAVALFKQQYGCEGLDISVQKNIPLSGGMGGSSVDAAGVLHALATMYNTQDVKGLAQIAARVGSDVPYLLQGGYARVGGMGEAVEYFESDKVFHIMVAQQQGSGVLSGDAYMMFDRLYPTKMYNPSCNDRLQKGLTGSSAFKEWNELANALTLPSIKLDNSIGKILGYLHESSGNLKAMMTGSGSCCVGFYKTAQEAHNAVDFIKSKACAGKHIDVTALQTQNYGMKIV